MRKQDSYTNSRFAWLTPLSGHLNSNGPWLIVEENTSATSQHYSESCRKVTHNYLLQTISNVLDLSADSHCKAARAVWQSACGRYSVTWNRSESNNSRLFVQRPDDYFSRIELLMEGQLLIAFQEPVWPHLQNDNAGLGRHLSIPADCLDAMELSANASNDASAYEQQSTSSAA